MEFEIDPAVTQSRFDIDPSDNTLKEAEAATVLKVDVVQEVESHYAGQPVIGALASKISMGILGDYAEKRMLGREPSLESVEQSLRSRLPILSLESLRNRIEALKELFPKKQKRHLKRAADIMLRLVP